MAANYRVISVFIKELNASRELLTKQQFQTLKGQAVSNNVHAARKGLERLIRRSMNE